ncbi:MAG: ABC transporter permease [Synergistaceae bacterium]|jgi:ribose transport system permease protein|nr:ABC transporter permease [Synergistaceae bacterium]
MSGENRGIGARILAIRGMPQVITVTVGLAIIFIIFSMLSENFVSARNLRNLLRQMAPILIIGIAQSFVLITGNIDLSIGSVVGMSCMISATLMTKGVSPSGAAAITVISCLLIGALNGVLVAKCGLPPFIGTLGTMTIARGIAQIVNNNHNTDSIGEGARAFRNLFYYGEFWGVYSTVWIALILWIIFNFILSATRTGRHIYAVGSNIEAARMSGVNIGYTVTAAYLVSAFCSCVVGFIACATGGVGTMDAGNMYELYAVAASVIGGVSTLGGQGLLLGTVIGASIWSVLQNGLILAGAPVAIRNIAVGVIVVISVLLDIIVRKGKWIKKHKTA